MTFSGLLLVTAGMAATGPVVAPPLPSEDCDWLSEVTRRHTLLRMAAFTGQAGATGQGVVIEAGAKICAGTTRAVSAGFTEGMAQAGMPVRWSFDSDVPYCDAHFLSQCAPFGDPSSSPFDAASLRTMKSAWRSIRQSVTAHMPWGTTSDVSYFTVESLDARLQRAAGNDEGNR